MAINFGGVLYAWDSGQIIALFVIAAALLLAFVVQQKLLVFTTLSDRIFPLHFLRMKEPMLLGILMAANNAATFVLMYYLPLYFQFVKGAGSLNSGVKLLPLIILITATIMLNGGVMSKTGYYQPWYVFGSVLLLVGAVLICKSKALAICAAVLFEALAEGVLLTNMLLNSSNYPLDFYRRYIRLRSPNWDRLRKLPAVRLCGHSGSPRAITHVLCRDVHVARYVTCLCQTRTVPARLP